MIGERLKRARAASGLSMANLGQAIGVSANMIKKYEHDESMPSSSVLIRLCDALSVRSEYFFRPNTVSLEGIEYRKKASTPQKVINQLTADVLDQAERWFELRNLWPEFPVDEFVLPAQLPAIESLDDVEKAAQHIRQHWHLGLNPIPELIDLLESQGVLVIQTESEHANQFDGLQATVENVPIIVVSKHWPGDRQRFTLAHELGHLVLHDRLPTDIDEEKACNRFAGAFLIPQEGVWSTLGQQRHNLEWKELDLLKHEYGLSIQALLYRCKDLGVISDEKFAAMCRTVRQKGWHRQEPGRPYPPEHTQHFEQLVYRGAGEGILSDSKAAELLAMPVSTFRKSRVLAEVGD